MFNFSCFFRCFLTISSYSRYFCTSFNISSSFLTNSRCFFTSFLQFSFFFSQIHWIVNCLLLYFTFFDSFISNSCYFHEFLPSSSLFHKYNVFWLFLLYFAFFLQFVKNSPVLNTFVLFHIYINFITYSHVLHCFCAVLSVSRHFLHWSIFV